MKAKIKEHINDPGKLEQLYRADRKAFKSGFEQIYPEIQETGPAEYWKIRLDYEKIPERNGKTDLREILILISACFISGLLIKIPDILNIAMKDFPFYEKNAAIIVFSGLTFYFVLANRIFDLRKIAFILTAFFLLAIYVNLLPQDITSSTINLVYIHLPLLLWFIYGLVFIDFDLTDRKKRIGYIRYNGDLAVLMAVLAISGGILTGITVGLFDAIGIKIEEFYMENVVLVGAVSVPIVATYIFNSYSSITDKIAPVIAGIFSPIVLLTALVYLLALTFSGRDLYSDREFLLIFNIMLIGVMAVIVFSISEASASVKHKFNGLIIFSLSVITVIIDLIALSAIFYRLGSFGITPNRLSVMGSNILILGNIVLIVVDMFRVSFGGKRYGDVELTISRYLPAYLIWIIFVVFGFPLIFGLK
jgi:hypothetical protein